ncbi:hypothetical protein ISF_06761 [Cordyceps fumosorosea ARSEF 2679]|uniref:DUF6546 domain-containing protein n=1 Tax=Cordyceps fumosorosea (strain ARSEF 2679) TaxID=1081104 RepID=A0A167R2V2_CORFA|nr:hypothetical protein ISF_06761 [Cordyceps fumosorosea ARSEF 2679]OAA58222.1 hypothetical protein ISF_06761 [Cordyceps fumosorosea ARSEF 2679]
MLSGTIYTATRPLSPLLESWKSTVLDTTTASTAGEMDNSHVPMECFQSLTLRELWNVKSAVLNYYGQFQLSLLYQSGILSLPSTAKNLVLFEDFNEDYSRIITTDPETADWSYRPGLHRTPSPLVADVLVSLVQIEKLAASYLVDAYDFFLCAGHRTSFWWRLSSLYLTSPHLVPETDRRCIDFILTLAGCVAERMPVLDTMVIWYGAKGVASEFRYEVTAKGRHASVRWRGTFDHPLATDTLKAWQRVARLRGAELTEKESVLLKAGEVYSHGAAIAELGLGGHVIHPVSLEQICGETSRYWFK